MEPGNFKIEHAKFGMTKSHTIIHPMSHLKSPSTMAIFGTIWTRWCWELGSWRFNIQWWFPFQSALHIALYVLRVIAHSLWLVVSNKHMLNQKLGTKKTCWPQRETWNSQLYIQTVSSEVITCFFMLFLKPHFDNILIKKLGRRRRRRGPVLVACRAGHVASHVALGRCHRGARGQEGEGPVEGTQFFGAKVPVLCFGAGKKKTVKREKRRWLWLFFEAILLKEWRVKCFCSLFCSKQKLLDWKEWGRIVCFGMSWVLFLDIFGINKMLCLNPKIVVENEAIR